jgi:hypothetical protein
MDELNGPKLVGVPYFYDLDNPSEIFVDAMEIVVGNRRTMIS